MIGDIVYNNKNISSFQPTEEVAKLTGQVKRAYNDGYEILHRNYEELNNHSVISRMNKDQRTFNSFVDDSVEDPREAWKWRGTRSMARNRSMAMHAHLTSSYIIPNVFAQNDQDDADEEMAEICRDLLEWMTLNSNYRNSFLLTTMGMLVNPVTYMGVDFNEIMQKIKFRTESGKWTTKEILDEELSGFDTHVYSADQILITNAYEQNIQRQRTVIKRRYVEYEEAEALFGEHENFDHVSPGVKSIYNEEDGLFYDVKEDDNDKLVEIVYAESRREDAEVPFVNGIYMGDDDVELNPMRHRDNRGAPKYDVVPFGYERINEHFFYYKSLINNVGWDNALLDALYEVTMNKEILDLLSPVAISGVDEIDTDIMMPGTVVAFENPDAKVSPILPKSNNASGYNAMQSVENSIKEGSISDTKMGQLPQASQKAYSVAQAEQNAQTLLGAVGKTLGQSVAQIGQLMIDVVLQHLTTAQVDEITGDINYRNFLLEDQAVEGKKVSKKIIFSEALNGKQMSEEKRKEKAIKMLEETGYPKNKSHLYMVNPHLFSKQKYMIRVEPDTMIPKNQAFEQAMDQEMYTLLRQDPMINPEQLIRDLIQGRKKNPDEYIVEKQEPKPEDIMGSVPGTQAGAQAKSQALAPAQVGMV